MAPSYLLLFENNEKMEKRAGVPVPTDDHVRREADRERLGEPAAGLLADAAHSRSDNESRISRRLELLIHANIPSTRVDRIVAIDVGLIAELDTPRRVEIWHECVHGGVVFSLGEQERHLSSRGNIGSLIDLDSPHGHP